MYAAFYRHGFWISKLYEGEDKETTHAFSIHESHTDFFGVS